MWGFQNFFFPWFFKRKWGPFGYLEPSFKVFITFVLLNFKKEISFLGKLWGFHDFFGLDF